MNKIYLIVLAACFAVSGFTLNACTEDGHEHENQHATEEHGHDDHGDHDNHAEETPHAEMSLESVQKAGIQLAEVQPATVDKTVHLIGKITENPDMKSSLHGRFEGVAVKVLAQLGQQVKKGQTLAQVESNESLQVYDVKAPIAGTVITRNINVGDSVGSHEMFQIADLSEVWAEVHIFPQDMSLIKKGAKVNVYDLTSLESTTTSLILILPTADAYSQTVVGIAPLQNSNGQWLPGMAIEADVSVEQRIADLTVAVEAIQTLENQTVVFVYEGGKFEAREVTLGLKGQDVVEVTSGLKAGEVYASKGSFVVKADMGKAAAEHSH